MSRAKFIIRAKCTLCKKKLLDSNLLTREQVKANWDSAVLEAPLKIKCDCHPKDSINFALEFEVMKKTSDGFVEQDKSTFGINGTGIEDVKLPGQRTNYVEK